MTESALPPVAIFLVWVVFLTIVVTAILVYRWRHPLRHSRFQLKLTLILFLFLMVPTVPLVYIAGSMVDQIRALLVALPVDDALEQGLEMVRQNITDEELRLRDWVESTLQETAQSPSTRPDLTIDFQRGEDGRWQAADLRLLRAPAGVERDALSDAVPDPRTDQPDALDDAFFTGEERVLFHHEGQGVYMALLRRPGSDRLEGAGIWVAPGIVEARFAIDRGLRNFRRITGLGGRATQEFLWTLASLWLVVLTVIAFVVSRFLASGVSGPVLELAEGMERVADGDLTARVDIRAHDEIGVLVSSFNAMTGQLREARDQIVLAEKQAAWRDVARRIAHEIKNPLTPIQIGLHRIRGRLQKEGIWESDSALQESLRTMNEEVEALRRMAASFSDYAQLPQPAMREADLEEILRGAAALFQQGPTANRIDLRIKGHIPPLEMDPELVKRALINLIKNAQESVEEAGSGTVRLRLEEIEGGLLLEVQDDGVGFEPDVASRLFHPDFTTKDRGTGLGLSVVSRVVADHNWRIEAQSEGRGRGAVLRLHIPVRRTEH